MRETARFAYLQARLQARHGARPDATTWHHLHSIGSLSNYLQAARRGPLRPWVLGIQATHDCDTIELSLRRQFREYVDEVAHWVPAPWRNAVRHVRQLPDLPLIQHLLNGDSMPAWVREDSELRGFAGVQPNQREEALLDSPYAYLQQGWNRGASLPRAWHTAWQATWPRRQGSTTALQQLGERLLDQIEAAVNPGRGSITARRAWLVQRLTAAFRRHGFDPASAFIHLALVAVDLDQLRSDLASRAVFTPASTEAGET